MKKIRLYLSLIRLNYHISIISILIGATFASPILLPLNLIISKIIILLVSFTLFYGGIYTINDLSDSEKDKLDERKKHRAIPSGQISKRGAFLFSIFLLGTGLSTAFFVLGKNVATIFLIFLIINLLYTFSLKHIPFLELFINCTTHPLRIVLGASLFDGNVPLIFLLGYYFLMVGFGLKIREIMMENNGAHSRPTLKYYTSTRLRILKIIAFVLLLLIALVDFKLNLRWYILFICVYTLSVFDIPILRKFSKVFQRTYKGK